MRKISVKSLVFVLPVIFVLCLFFGCFTTLYGGNSAKSIIKNAEIQNTFANFEQNNELNPNNLIAVSTSRNVSTGKVLIEQSSRRILWSENENARLYPASTTKVLTALCVLDNLPLDRVVEVPKCAEGVEGSSIYLKEGQKITIEDLLFGLMLRSGNDAAVTLAVETSGSVEDFAVLMNEKAKECGAVNSNFVNPHGLQDENHYTTAYDLALITAKAYENADFVRIVSSKLKKITIDDNSVVIANKNKMLKLFDDANGVKTGFTKSSGRCLVSGAKRGDIQLISVVLNCGDMWNESVRMLDFGFDNFKMIPLENFLLTNGEKEITVQTDSFVDENWHCKKYPLRKDGSEKLVVKIK